MKSKAILFILILLSLKSYSQIGAVFNEVKMRNVSPLKLNSIYKSAIGIDSPMKGAFSGNEAIFIDNFKKMVDSLRAYFNQNGLKWGKSVSCFNKIYFDYDGSIAYFFSTLGLEKLNRKKSRNTKHY